MKNPRPSTENEQALTRADDHGTELLARRREQWSLGIDLITSFIGRIETPGAKFGEVHLPVRTKTRALTFPWCEQSELVTDFVKVMYENHLVVVFDWTAWSEGTSLAEHPESIAGAGFTECLKFLTAQIRQDRFCEGHLIAAFEQGQIASVLRRLHELRRAKMPLDPLLELKTF